MSFWKKLGAVFASSISGEKYDNDDAANCSIGGSLLVAAADGNIDAEEIRVTREMAGANKRLDGFDLRAIFNDWEAQIKLSVRTARRDFFSLAGKVRERGNLKDCEDILFAIIEVADSSCEDGEPLEGHGNIDKDEMNFIEQAAEALGLDAKKYLAM